MPPPSRLLLHETGRWELDLDRRELRSGGASVPIGSRAFEIVETLVRSAGELVTKDEIMASVWPGSIVEENTLQVHVSAVRKALGSDRTLLRTTSGRGYRLLGRWTERQDARVGHPAAARHRDPVVSVPRQASGLVGRDDDVSRIRDLLTAYRTVTLTGPGGIGKTRLALEALSACQQSWPERVVVELAPVSAPAMVGAAVAGTLGVIFGESELPETALAQALGSRSLLLVLDNCEHVVGAAAGLVENLVRACPGVTVLATSREPLRTDGEYAYRVQPLGLGAPGALPGDVATLPSAMRLFLLRMEAADSRLVPSQDDLATIAAICRRLDGLPLAIEFAAARAATLGVSQVLSRLNDRFDILTVSRRTALPRHATLRATLDWSYDLLSGPEQSLLRRLSVFAAPFTLDAAMAVAGLSETDPLGVEDGIASLVSKSLLNLETGPSESRWRLLETSRAYAHGKLRQAPDHRSTVRRHAEYFLGLPSAVAKDAASAEAAHLLDRYRGDLDEVRAAHDWAFSPEGDVALGGALTAAYVPIWLHFSLMSECRDRVETALFRIGSGSALDDDAQMRLFTALGVALIDTTGLLGKTSEVLERALAIADRRGDPDWRLRVLWAMWADRSNNGDNRAAYAIARSLFRAARASRDATGVVVGRRLLGNTLHYLGKHARASDRLHAVLTHYSVPRAQQPNIWFHYDQRVLAKAMLSRVLLLQGFPDQALILSRASLDDARATGHKLSLCYALGEAVCPVSSMVEAPAVSARFVAEFTGLAESCGFLFWMSLGRCLAAQLLISTGDTAKGVALLREALDVLRRTGRAVMHYPQFLGVLAQGLARLGLLAEARATMDEALARARTGEPWCAAELLRLQGTLLLQQGGAADIALGERCMLDALHLARRQGALFWELRAAMDLAGLARRKGRTREARDLLASVHNRFTEGFDTPDLRSAGTLLRELASEIGEFDDHPSRGRPDY